MFQLSVKVCQVDLHMFLSVVSFYWFCLRIIQNVNLHKIILNIVILIGSKKSLLIGRQRGQQWGYGPGCDTFLSKALVNGLFLLVIFGAYPHYYCIVPEL